MTFSDIRRMHCAKRIALSTVLLMGTANLMAGDNKKTSNPPPKVPAAATRTAPPAGAGNGGGARTGGATKPTTIPPRPPQPREGLPRDPHTPVPRTPINNRQSTLKSGSSIQTRPDGRVAEIHDPKRGMEIHHGLNGGSRVTVERAGHSRIVAEHGRRGFIQHPYTFRGHEFARRSYYYHGRYYDRFYHHYFYRGLWVDIYAPYRFYSAGFYGWVYNPWYSPAVYAWGWGGSPWFGFYGGYFAPYPSYPSASLWLTDYMVASDLQAEYQAGQDTQAMPPQPQAAGGEPTLTPDVKQQIADEVRNQIALANSEAAQNAANQEPDPASSGIARMLSDGQPHTFVVGGALDVVDSSGAECALSGGDVLGMKTAPNANAAMAALVVLASKGAQECQKSATVTVALNDLQEMQNHMRETIDQGLEQLQMQQGKSGLPPAPPSAQAAPVTTAFAQNAPPPDPNGAVEINQQLSDANASEQDVVAQSRQETGAAITAPALAPQVSAPPAGGVQSIQQPSTTATAPPSISIGQTVDQVTSTLGQPLRVLDLGVRGKMFQYPNLKVTFKAGKVADVQ